MCTYDATCQAPSTHSVVYETCSTGIWYLLEGGSKAEFCATHATQVLEARNQKKAPQSKIPIKATRAKKSQKD